MAQADRNANLLSMGGRFNSLFKAFLLIGIFAIGAVFIYYTQDVIREMQSNEAQIADTYTRIWQLVASDSTSGPVTSVLFDEIILKSNFPIVVTDADERPLFWKGLPGLPDNTRDSSDIDKIFVRAQKMKASKGEKPIYIDSVVIYKLFYDDPPIVDKLRWIPIVEMAMVFGFIVITLFGFQYIRRSEQRSIWVGMAKETAHQLGTPITSLMGWTSLMRSGETAFDKEEIYDKIEKDLTRLGMIASRFGKIGSKPTLEKQDINHIIGEVVDYYRERLPHGGQGLKIEFEPGDIPKANINAELYGWVVENLLKNSLEAVDGKTGRIQLRTYLLPSGKSIVLEVIDNGKGIQRGDARRIFRPGYSTKKRGWGLGLSLARRIIHDYHRGNISLAGSDPQNGTVFKVFLPVAK